MGRAELLEALVEQALGDLNPVMPGYSATLKAVAGFHAELEQLRAAARPPPEKESPEAQIEEWRRECPNLPDQLLEIAVAVYGDRHGLVMVPKALRAA